MKFTVKKNDHTILIAGKGHLSICNIQVKIPRQISIPNQLWIY